MNLFDEMNTMFDDFSHPFFRTLVSPQTMKTDIRQEDGLYLLSMDLPGYKKEDIKAELKDGYLTITAEKNGSEEQSEKDGYIVKERYSGSCSRSFYVGDHVTEDNIKAAYTDGTLHLSFPSETQQQIAQTKQIPIA
jgi:HSP20 family molecular chaperone IbpA